MDRKGEAICSNAFFVGVNGFGPDALLTFLEENHSSLPDGYIVSENFVILKYIFYRFVIHGKYRKISECIPTLFLIIRRLCYLK